MKPKRIILGLLCAGIILGGGLSAQVVNADITNSETRIQNQQEMNIVELKQGDVEMQGDTIIGVISHTVAQKLIDGGKLVIPKGLATGIGHHAFALHQLEAVAGHVGRPGITSVSGPGIVRIDPYAFHGNQIKSIELPSVIDVGPAAFESNQIQSLDLPSAIIVGSYAFYNNQIKSLELPSATNVEDHAFAYNQIKSLDLPSLTEVGRRAFNNNELYDISLPNKVSITDHAFMEQYNDDRRKSEATNIDPMKFSDVLESQKLSFKIGGVEQLTPENINIKARGVTVDNDKQTISNPKKVNPIYLSIEAPRLQYSIHSQISLTEKPPVTPPVTPPTTNPGGENEKEPVDPTPPTDTPTLTDPVAPDKPTVESPNYVDKKGSTVHAIKGLYMYKAANFIKTQRIAKYPKQKRINRPMFVITDYARSKGGPLRYKLKDVNHNSKSAGKIGYITANHKYVVPAYYQSMPKNKQITVIGKNGIHAYKNETLTKRTRAYRKGTNLTVKKIVKHNLTTRYQLTNGDYVSANKRLIIQGRY